MFIENLIHFLDSMQKKASFARESRIIHFGPSTSPSKTPQTREHTTKNSDKPKKVRRKLQEQYKEELAKSEEYKKDLDTYLPQKEVKKTYTRKIKDPENIGIAIRKGLSTKTIPKVLGSENFKEFAFYLERDISIATKENITAINNHLPITIKLGPGGSLEYYNKKKDFSLKLDLKKDLPWLRLVQRQLEESTRLRKGREQARARINTQAKKHLEKLRRSIKPAEALTDIIGTQNSPYLKKRNGIFVINFKKHEQIDRKAERRVKIQDVLNLSHLDGGNMYVRIHLDGVSPAGKKHKYWAYYHPSQKTFIIEGTTKRAKIFHGTKIDKIEYRTSKPKKAVVPKTAPKTKSRLKLTEKERIKRRLGRIEKNNLINLDENYRYISKNQSFSVPRFLQNDDDFERNWGRIDATIETALTGAPFNLKTTQARRKYIQTIIQENLNSRLYAKDFFEMKVNGKDLYKGGYEKFLKDINTRNLEQQKYKTLSTVAFGLAKVFEALGKLSLHPKQSETSKDIYRVKFLGIKQLTPQEKSRLGTLKYHSLQSLLHGKESAPYGVDIGINDKMLKQIKSKVSSKDENPDLDTSALLKEKGGLKLMFMAFGLNTLIEKGCIKKIDDKHYVIVKIPNTTWGPGLDTIQQNKVKLYGSSKENLKKWEKVRESLNNGRRARNFILKIFKPNGSEVKQDINWWKKLWHWDFKSKKKITMAYLGKATLNPSELEKHVATDRGYLDMMEKTSKRVEGTSLYEPQKAEVLRSTNSYLENGLLATFMNTTPKNLANVTKQILRDFSIENKVKLKKPLNNKENKMANIKAIHKAISLKGLNSDYLTQAHIRMIRMGYVLGRQIETAQNWNDVMTDNLSTKPLYRAIQLKALRDGAPIYKLKEIEQRVHLAIFGLSKSMHAPGVHTIKVRGGGAVAAIDLGEWAGQKWHITVGAAGIDGKFMPLAEVGASIKLGKKVKLKWSLGTTIGFTGASTAVEFPITSEWDMYAGVGVGADWKGAVGVGAVGVGAAIGAKWNKLRAEKLRETKAVKERGISNIDKLIKDKGIDKAAKLILKNPTFGDYVKALKSKFKLPNSVVVDIYKNARTEWLNAARRGVKIPAVTGFGVGVFTGVSANPLENGISIGAYITFKIPGTNVNYVIRQEHPKYSEYVQTQVAQEALKRELKKKGKSGKNIISPYTLSASTGVVYFDSRLGRGHVARPNKASEMKQSIAIRQGRERSANIANRSSFEAIKRTFTDLDMHVEMVPDPKNPKQHLLAITPLQLKGSNAEILLDPELRNKGIILDKKNNRILVAASAAKKLLVTRTKYRYPFARKGAMNLEVIAFKTNRNKSNIEIRQDSPRYIYKYKGERYTMVRGEARTGISEGNSNTMTLDQYKKRKSKFETFQNKKLEYGLQEGRTLTSKMTETVGYKEQEPIRVKELKLADFASRFLETNLRKFEAGVGNADTIQKEMSFKASIFGDLKESFKTYAKGTLENENLSINEQELNFVYTYMLNLSFTKLASKSEAVINRRLERRNRLFKAHMRKYITEFKESNPEKWAQIKAIDPSVSPESIANYLMLTMPQNANQFKEFLKAKGLPITEGLKFASYTRKHGGHEAFATSYGTQMPKEFQNIFKMLNPRRLNFNSSDPKERAAAKLVLQVMSPLSTKNLENINGKKAFLESELSLLLISMYDGKTGISPMIEVLGKKNYKGMITIYKALKDGKLTEAISANPQAFDQFKILVMSIRQAQLNAEPTYIFKNKYIFHLNRTRAYSGPYLKCGNGTIAVRQQIGISIKHGQVDSWHSAKTAKNISVIPNERAGAATMTAGWAHTFRSRPRPTKEEPSDRHKAPKGEVQDRHNNSQKTEVPNKSTNNNSPTSTPPVSKESSDSI